jgi:hypothetical protein
MILSNAADENKTTKRAERAKNVTCPAGRFQVVFMISGGAFIGMDSTPIISWSIKARQCV